MSASSDVAPAARGRNRWFAVAALAVAGAAFAVITAGGIGENLVYYWGPKELRGAGDKAIGATIRLGGQVGKGSIRQLGGSTLEFDVVDDQASVRVRTSSIPPQMFREEIGVVVEGTMTKAGYFESKRLMVSHGNEYRAPEDGEKVDAKKLMQSTQGLQGADEKAKP